MSKVDLELKRAFNNLQIKALETSQKLKISDVQIEAQRTRKKRAVFTEKEISELDENIKLYESVGRMFYYAPKAEVLENLKQVQIAADDKIKTYENNKVYLERSMKDAENNLREMVQQRK